MVRRVTSAYDPFQTARATAAAIRARQVSPLEVLETCLARVDSVNNRLNAVIWRNDEEARSAAREAGDVIVRSDPSDLPPFFGVPVPVKDVTAVAGWPTTRGSWTIPDTPSVTSDLVVEALQRAGFILCARTNAPEFGALLVTENLRYGVTRNPWDLDRTPGGSSGGAAAAVAGGLFPLAHGNDGAGSIRVPASCCGLVGLKVSRGRAPARYQGWEGAVVEGALTHDVADTAAVLDVISGPDPGQWYNAPAPERPFLAEVGADPGQLRIGLIEDAPLGLEIEPVCKAAGREAAAALEKRGHHVDVVSYQVPDEVLIAFLNVVNTGLADHDFEPAEAEPHIQAGLAAARGRQPQLRPFGALSATLEPRVCGAVGAGRRHPPQPHHDDQPAPGGRTSRRRARKRCCRDPAAPDIADERAHRWLQYKRPTRHLVAHPRERERDANRGSARRRSLGGSGPPQGVNATGASAPLG